MRTSASPQTVAAQVVPNMRATSPIVMRVGVPEMLTIEDIGLQAGVEPVWLAEASAEEADRISTAGTQIALPSSGNVVGWYALGAVPGQPGSTLMLGHLDTTTGPAVFATLPAIHVGATIHLSLVDNSQCIYDVDDYWNHPADQPAPAELFLYDGPSRLYLVTCIGRFVRSAGGYQHRLIVRATLRMHDETPTNLTDSIERIGSRASGATLLWRLTSRDERLEGQSSRDTSEEAFVEHTCSLRFRPGAPAAGVRADPSPGRQCIRCTRRGVAAQAGHRFTRAHHRADHVEHHWPR